MSSSKKPTNFDGLIGLVCLLLEHRMIYIYIYVYMYIVIYVWYILCICDCMFIIHTNILYPTQYINMGMSQNQSTLQNHTQISD